MTLRFFKGRAMKSGLFAGLLAGSLMLTAAHAASAPVAQSPLQIAGSAVAMPQKDPQTARPFTAVLRYGPGTTSICRGLPDNSTAICLLLALHVMQLSQKPVNDTKL
jgi:hypothetical protein